jgi:hypothetical protein
MEHPKDEELIAFHDGDPANHERVEEHLRACSECRAALEKIEVVFAAMDSLPVPDPGENYGQRVWAAISPRLPERQPRWWEGFFAPRRLVAAGAFAAIVVAAFIAGRLIGRPPVKPADGEVVDVAKIRERVLVVAVRDHLDKSEMILVELSNAQANPSSGKLVNISSEQRRAEDLLDENRLYRQTALQEGDQVMASTLDELERTLLDIANGPDEVTPARFEAMQKRLESRGILFKVRVVKQGLRERGNPAKQQPVPQRNISKTNMKEGNQV